MDLSTLGTLTFIIYLLGIFAFQWITDWYFEVTESNFLDFCHFLYIYYNGDLEKELDA